MRVILKCPVCKDQKLADQPLDDGIVAAVCAGCGGQWIDSARYWKWLESRPQETSNRPGPDAKPSTLPVIDSAPGKFCPGCGRFLARVKPGYGLEFFLNRCGGCGGIWLDANEWANLRSIGLHDDIHFIFSDSWQAEISKAERTRQHEQLLADKLGPEALAEIKRIKTWLDGNPKKAELYAYLIGPKDSGPSKR
jgi:Zn-finger nucleic acid-binding protein